MTYSPDYKKYYAYFINEGNYSTWTLIDEKHYSGIKDKNPNYVKEVPAPAFRKFQKVYHLTKYWYTKATVVDIVPTFNNSGFSHHYYYIGSSTHSYTEDELYSHLLFAIKEAVINFIKTSFKG